MKYWLLTSEFPPFFGGGISTYCYHTANMMCLKGHEVTVFLPDFNIASVAETNEKNGCRVIRFPLDIDAQSSALGYETKLSYALARTLVHYMEKEGNPDVIETQDYLGIGYYIQQMQKLKYVPVQNTPILVTMHAPAFLYLPHNQVNFYKLPEYWYCEMEKSSLAMAGGIVSPSKFLIDKVRGDIPGLEEKAVHIFNPYNAPKGEPTLDFTKNEVVFFGKLTPQKGCLELFKYMAQLWDEGFAGKLRIVGGGKHFFYPAQMDMQDYIAQKYKTYIDLGLVIFEGNCAPEKAMQLLKNAHVVVVPSIVDNLPYTVIEAMSLGKVVLASTDGGHRELIEDGVSGFLFEHGQKGDFGETLNKILSLDNATVQKIGKAAIDHVQKKTSYDAVYAKKIKVVENLISNHRTSSEYPFVYPIERNQITPNKNLEKGRLSVVIPYYNMHQYLEDTLKSLQKVPMKNMEVIVVNDGSTEASTQVFLKKMEETYPVRVVNKQNEGLAATRNFGANLVTGEYLAFLDADDTVEPGYYPKAIEILSSYSNVDFVGCWAKYFGENTDFWPAFTPEPPYFLFHNTLNTSALVYKTESFLNFGENDPEMCYGMEDYESAISMLENGMRGVALPEAWWNYRIRKNSMQQSFNVNSQLYLYRLIADKHKGFYAKFAHQLVNLLNHNGPGFFVDNPTFYRMPAGRDPGLKLNGRLLRIVKKNRLLRTMAKKAYNKITSK